MPVDRHVQPVRSCPDSDTSGPQLRNGELAIRAHRGDVNKFKWNQTSSVRVTRRAVRVRVWEEASSVDSREGGGGAGSS